MLIYRQKIDPAPPRSIVEPSVGGITVRITRKFRWYSFIETPVVLAAWIGMLKAMWPKPGTTDWSAWLPVVWFSVILAAVVIQSLWHTLGETRLEFSRSELRVGREIFGIGWTTRYNMADVSRFRYCFPERKRNQWRIAAIAFDVRNKEKRLAVDLDEAEVNDLLLQVRQALPDLKDRL